MHSVFALFVLCFCCMFSLGFSCSLRGIMPEACQDVTYLHADQQHLYLLAAGAADAAAVADLQVILNWCYAGRASQTFERLSDGSLRWKGEPSNDQRHNCPAHCCQGLQCFSREASAVMTLYGVLCNTIMHSGCTTPCTLLETNDVSAHHVQTV